ncbi:unnamed protein product [Callosobruchus maculatus]|uniref:HAT C-terminal dimerisation domain-containing protein n=1 Tax=Callosobruchus maculatus TaxID=64391 RepID=A0A653BJV2_CALMS|nr:unnamed protein product [Callosobruchus maculatus]
MKEELQQRRYAPLHIIRLKRSGTPMPLVVVVDKSREVFNEHELLGLAIRVEVQKNSRLIGQCHRCQRYEHAQTYCTAPPKCLKCASDHMTHLCPKTGLEERKLNGRDGGLAVLVKRGIDYYRSTNAVMQTIEAASVVVNMAGGVPLKITSVYVRCGARLQEADLEVLLDCSVFCGTHDMPLRGKQADEGVLLDLLKLRIDSGDNKLKSHFEKCRRNAIYTSPRIQNELINLCGEVIQENVISEVRKTMAYSILADETADVSGKEQLSIGVRFYDESKSKIREEFVGFVELKAQNASAIAEAIDNFLISSNLSKEDCVGFGFDGCSTMAGKEGGVQAILRKKYPRALYFHCSSHKLNLVVNDANAVPEIRNTVATVKDVITFFRESTTRRNYAPNLSRLCETRWSEKYKSIRKFSQHFSELVKSLETLSVEGNYATRKSAYQLHSAVTKPVFIVSLQTIAKYSAVIEPVVNALQAKSIDMISVGKHIKNIKDILRNDREFPDRISNEILQKARAVAMDLNIEISVPRLAHKQTHRSNPPSDNDNEYWRRSLIIPYIDSLISSWNIRFSQENTPAFALSRLHPLYMTKTSIADLHKNAESFQEFYNLDITGELNLWHNLWVTKALSDDQLKDIEVVDLFKEANIFYPAVRKALIILSTIPCTTATVERSFSTLRRVKTWLRSTMGEERLTDNTLSAIPCITSGVIASNRSVGGYCIQTSNMECREYADVILQTKTLVSKGAKRGKISMRFPQRLGFNLNFKKDNIIIIIGLILSVYDPALGHE